MSFVAIGAFVGAFTAAVKGGNVLKGAVMGGVLGAVGGQIAGAGAGAEGGIVSTEVGGAAAGGSAVESGIGTGLMDAGTGLAATEAGTVAETGLLDAMTGEVLSGAAIPESAATGLIEGNLPTPVAAPSASTPGAEALEGATAASAAPQTAAQEVVGAAPQGAASDASLWQQVKAWAEAHPQLASAALQVGGSTLGGIASGAGQYMTAERRAQLELENKEKLTEYYRKFVQSGSTGGAGVTLGVKPRPNAGLVQRLM
jgi:hypothetical protein